MTQTDTRVIISACRAQIRLDVLKGDATIISEPVHGLEFVQYMDETVVVKSDRGYEVYRVTEAPQVIDPEHVLKPTPVGSALFYSRRD